MGIFTSFMSNLFSTALLSKASHPKATAATAASTAANVIDTLFTSEEERLDKQTVLARVALHADALQSRINTAESQHRSRFVAGWRPFIGWVCGMALAWHFILLPLCQFGLAVLGIPPSSPSCVPFLMLLLRKSNRGCILPAIATCQILGQDSGQDSGQDLGGGFRRMRGSHGITR